MMVKSSFNGPSRDPSHDPPPPVIFEGPSISFLRSRSSYSERLNASSVHSLSAVDGFLNPPKISLDPWDMDDSLHGAVC